jgi:predicted DNA-binding protein (MmcQ/YjbR family)
MTWDDLRTYCLARPDAIETFPFEPAVSVFKAPGGKMFAIASSRSEPLDVSVKCDPDIAEALRGEYQSIVPGYHLNKRHWITITLGRDVPDSRVRELVLDSYELVAKGTASRSSKSS